MNYRLIVCFDFEAPSLDGAYRELRNKLLGKPYNGLIGWETSDEAYKEGDTIDEQTLTSAICRVLAEDQSE